MARLTARHVTGRKPVSRRRTIKNPDPNRHYRWVHESRVTERQEDYEYRVERRDGTTKNPQSLDGAIRSGDCVLMSCSRAEYDSRVVERAEMAAENVAGPVEAFKMQGLKNGVEIINRTKSSYGPMEMVVPQAAVGRIPETES